MSALIDDDDDYYDGDVGDEYDDDSGNNYDDDENDQDANDVDGDDDDNDGDDDELFFNTSPSPITMLCTLSQCRKEKVSTGCKRYVTDGLLGWIEV